MRMVYQHTQGYPRRIAMFCHDALETVVMKGKLVIDEEIIGGLINQEAQL